MAIDKTQHERHRQRLQKAEPSVTSVMGGSLIGGGRYDKP